MDSNRRYSRRHLLAIGSLPCVFGLAGCLGTGDGQQTAAETDERIPLTATEDGDDTTPADTGEGDFLSTDEEPDYDGWFEDVPGFEGTADRCGHQLVFATLGGETKFDPLALAVDAGTTVDWGWDSTVGDHTITHEGEEFDSGTVGFQGFEHRFDTPDIYRYYCEFHLEQGMKGAVVVLDG